VYQTRIDNNLESIPVENPAIAVAYEYASAVAELRADDVISRVNSLLDDIGYPRPDQLTRFT
jgi:hypothetical protein